MLKFMDQSCPPRVRVRWIKEKIQISVQVTLGELGWWRKKNYLL